MPQTIQRSFTSGEIAPALRSRADLAKYTTGLALCENFFVRAQGGVYSRQGLRFIGELDDSSKKARLIPFSFNTEQTYVLVFEHLKVRVIRNGGFVLAGGGPAIFELATPYTEDELPRLGFTQSADVMTLVHPNHDPANLSRLADDNWTLVDIDYSSPVQAPAQPTLTSTGSGHGSNNKNYAYVVTALDENGVESLPSPGNSITLGSLTSTAGVKVNWPDVPGAVSYRVYKDPSTATGVYGWIGDSNTSQFSDFNLAPVTSDGPPADRQPFNGVNNKPSAVNYYQQRQVFANTYNEPQACYTTQTDTYDSLRTSEPARDDDAVTFTIAGRQVNEIRHIVALDALILLTSGGEWLVSEGRDEVLTPATVGVRIQSYNGASWVPPAIVNSTVLYLQEKGARIRDLGYQFSSDKYTGDDLSLMSEHLFEGYEITAMSYAAEPYSILWCVRSDGKLLGLTYQREHQVWGWHQHSTQGEFESITTVTEGSRDAVYVVVKRTINGQIRRYVERMEPRQFQTSVEAFCVDSGATYDGAPVTELSGLDHLEGEAVAVLTDGYVTEGLTVSGGSITLPRPASVVHVGLPFVSAIELLDVDIPAATDTVKAQSVSVSKVTIEVESSRGGFVGPIADSGSADNMLEIKPRFDSDAYDPIKLKTYKASIHIQPQWAKGGGIRIEQRSPLPLTILSVIPRIDVGN